MITLKTEKKEFYLVKKGDTAESVCCAANVSERALFRLNGLESQDFREGLLVRLPPAGNLYTVQAGDDAVTLCGSLERFELLNGDKELYPGRKVRI